MLPALANLGACCLPWRSRGCRPSPLSRRRTESGWRSKGPGRPTGGALASRRCCRQAGSRRCHRCAGRHWRAQPPWAQQARAAAACTAGRETRVRAPWSAGRRRQQGTLRQVHWQQRTGQRGRAAAARPNDRFSGRSQHASPTLCETAACTLRHRLSLEAEVNKLDGGLLPSSSRSPCRCCRLCQACCRLGTRGSLRPWLVCTSSVGGRGAQSLCWKPRPGTTQPN